MKKIIFLVAFLLLGINLTGTLSLFESKIDVPVEAELASWKIKVNDILIGQETDFEINDIVWENNPNIKDGKTAPSAKGYFDLEIIPDDVDVAFNYKITVDDTNYKDSNFKIESIEIENSDITKEEENIYTGFFSLDDIKNNITTKIRFNLVWENDEEKNDLDSEYIGIDKEIGIPITMEFSQYIQE